jgi:hypothetical protein
MGSFFAFAMGLGILSLSCRNAAPTGNSSPVSRADLSSVAAATQSVDQLLYEDDFTHGLDQWFIETESGGTVAAKNGQLDIDVPAGCTVWFKKKLEGSIAIEYTATAIQAGGPNDRVSDLNCFWMARDPKYPDDLFAHPRGGKFADYNSLLTYYVGQGGNGNTTTRFRRYIGDAVDRPLLPENDLRDAKNLLTPNMPQKIRLVADGNTIEYFRDGVRVFHLEDLQPYVEGWFGFRTTKSHLRIGDFRVRRIGHPAGQ